MNPLFKGAVGFVSDTIRLFYSGQDVERVLDRFADGFSWFGAGDIEYSTSVEDVRAYLAERAPLAPACHVSDEDLHLVNVGETQCTVMGRYWVRTDESSGMLVEEHQRCTYELVDDQGVLRIAHVHVSNPYQAMQSKPYFPFEAGEQNYQYLQRMLREKSDLIDTIADNINGGLKTSNDDEHYSFRYVGEGLCRLLGYTMDEFYEATGNRAVGMVYPADRDRVHREMAACFAEGPSYAVEYRARTKDGAVLWVYDSGRKSRNDDGTSRIDSIIIDITSRKETEQALVMEQERYRMALQSISDVLIEYDIEQDLLMEFERVERPGDSNLEQRALPRCFERLERGDKIHLDDLGSLRQTLTTGLPSPIEIRRRGDDSWFWMRLQGSLVRDESGQPVRFIGSWKDVSDEKRLIESLIDQTQRDPLTHLHNHAAAAEFVSAKLAACIQEERGALLILDIDDFKVVNDTYGHLAGNELLTSIARIMERVLPDGAFAARIGGDEFLVFLPHANRQRAAQTAEKLLAAAKSQLQRKDRMVTLSIGIALADKADLTFEQLFERADQALYRAKTEGKNAHRIAGE